jgi:hypothetical protein
MTIDDALLAKLRKYAEHWKITQSAAVDHLLMEGFRTLEITLQSESTSIEGSRLTPRSKTAPRA